MGTVIRPELSKKNRWYIDKHRYYELKHFCLQYKQWKHLYLSTTSTVSSSLQYRGAKSVVDPVAKAAEEREKYMRRMNMVEQSAIETDFELHNYILMAVTEELSYECLRTKYNIPCCKEVYYQLYHKFFYILDKVRK